MPASDNENEISMRANIYEHFDHHRNTSCLSLQIIAPLRKDIVKSLNLAYNSLNTTLYLVSKGSAIHIVRTPYTQLLSNERQPSH